MRIPSHRSARFRSSRVRAAALVVLGLVATLPPGADARAEHDVELGLNENWLQHTAALDLASELGASLIRFPGGWNEVERAGWSRFDRLYEAARDRGIRLIWKEVNAPCFARAGPCEAGVATPPALEHLDDFQAHLRAAVRRYPELAAVEIGNEPNLPVFYGHDPRPAHYVRWLEAGYEAVKSVRPDLPVLFGGVAGTDDSSGGKIPYDTFLRRTHALGAARFYDAMSLHPYPEPQDRPGYLAEIERKVATVKRAMARGGAGGRPIWITEIGLWTRAGGPRGLSEEAQAERTLAIYDALRRTPGIEAVVIHRLFDDPAGTGPEAGWGLIGADSRAPKPAYCRLGRARLGALPELCVAAAATPAPAPGQPAPGGEEGWPWFVVALVVALLGGSIAAFWVKRRR
jgi:polysaccharide biosynthesis protein PslG